jgi:hypothetical protein
LLGAIFGLSTWMNDSTEECVKSWGMSSYGVKVVSVYLGLDDHAITTLSSSSGCIDDLICLY